MATTYQQSAEQSQQDTWLTQKNTAPPQVGQTAHDVLVRPTLELATCAWAPHTKTGIQTIERVQRSAAPFVTGDYRRTSCAIDMCTNLWNLLYTRRRIRDASMFLKIHHGLMHIILPVTTTADAPTDANTSTNYEICQPLARPTSSHST